MSSTNNRGDLERALKDLGPSLHLLFLALGLIGALALFAPTVPGWFLADDFRLLDRAQTVTFTEHPGLTLIGDDPHSFSPLPALAFRAQYALFGLYSPLYRGVSLLLHLGAVLAVYALARRVTQRRAAAGMAGLAFALQPLSFEAVAWVSAQPWLWAGLFTALALERFLAWLEAEPGAGGGPLAGSIVLAALALGSHESAYGLPLLALAAAVLPGRAARLRSIAAVALVFALMVGAVVGLKYGLGFYGRAGGGAGQSFIAGLSSYLESARAVAPKAGKFFVPIVYLLWRQWRRSYLSARASLYGWIWLAATAALPGAIAVIDGQSSRGLYLPSLGFCVLFGAILGFDGLELRFKELGWRRFVRPAAAALLLAASLGMGIKQAGAWQEASRASIDLARSFLALGDRVKPGESARVERAPLAVAGVPLHRGSYTLSVALSIAGFPKRFTARRFGDRAELPFYAISAEVPATSDDLAGTPRLLELRTAPQDAFNYKLVWDSPWASQPEE